MGELAQMGTRPWPVEYRPQQRWGRSYNDKGDT